VTGAPTTARRRLLLVHAHPDDETLATGGTILVLAVPAAGGASVLVVNADTAGGPADAPPVPPRAVLDAVVTSARPEGI